MDENQIEKIAKLLLESKDYSKLSKKMLNKIVNGKDIEDLSDDFSTEKEKYIYEATFIVCDYANMILKDRIITKQEMKNIKYLKSKLGISDEMLYFSETAERIEAILTKQFRKIYEDHAIEEDEQMFIEQIQEMFNMPYDDCFEIISKLKK